MNLTIDAGHHYSLVRAMRSVARINLTKGKYGPFLALTGAKSFKWKILLKFLRWLNGNRT